jgi:hypothetical protein
MNATKNQDVINGLRKTILKFRELSGYEEDVKFKNALEEVSDKNDLIEIAVSWKEIAISKYNRQLCDILIENCKETIKI